MPRGNSCIKEWNILWYYMLTVGGTNSTHFYNILASNKALPRGWETYPMRKKGGTFSMQWNWSDFCWDKDLITGQKQCVQETVCTLERPANSISLILKMKKLFVFVYKKVKHVLLSKYLQRIWVYLLVLWRRAFHSITSMRYLTVRCVFREWKVRWLNI